MTDEELGRVRSAYLRVAHDYERLAFQKVRAERNGMKVLMKAWAKLDIEERAAVSLELAQMASPNGGETGEDKLMLAVDPHDLDVGQAAYRAFEAARDKGGNKVRAPGFNEAVEEAADVWEQRQNPREIGNIWNAFTPGQPTPLVAFVAYAVRTALPPEVIAKATSMNVPSDEKLFQSVEARLRKSR